MISPLGVPTDAGSVAAPRGQRRFACLRAPSRPAGGHQATAWHARRWLANRNCITASASSVPDKRVIPRPDVRVGCHARTLRLDKRVRVCRIPSQHPGPQPDSGSSLGAELALRCARHRQDRADERTTSRAAKGTSRGRGPRCSRAHRRRTCARHACAPRPLAENARPRCDRRVRDHTHREPRPAVAAVGSRVQQSQPNDAVTGTAPPRGESRLGGLSRSFFSVAGEDAVELVAGADVELGEDLVQVVFDGAGAHE